MTNRTCRLALCRLLPPAAVVLALGACSALRPAATPPPAFYSLEAPRSAGAAPRRPGRRVDTAPTLIVNPPHAAAGFDSPRIIYVREPHKLEYFAHSEWVDTPARMLAPLLVAAIEQHRGLPRRGADAERRGRRAAARHRDHPAAAGVRRPAQPGALHAARLPRRRQDAPRARLARVRGCRSGRQRRPLRRRGGGQSAVQTYSRSLRRSAPRRRADGDMSNSGCSDSPFYLSWR